MEAGLRQDEHLPHFWLAALAAVFAVLLVYSQTEAFAWDEGFHLLAAQLILGGKKPYLDFCFPQTPLNAYWNAAWMGLIGDSWRSAHALAAVETGLSVVLAADFVRLNFPEICWRLSAAAATALVLGLNVAIVEDGTIGQPYALCLLLLVLAFRITLMAAGRSSAVRAGVAGLLSACAAASSLLTAAAVPVFLIWILWHSSGRRLTRFFSFAAGAMVPFLPILWLFTRAPRVVFFNLVQYQLLYRRSNWEDAGAHDVDVLTSWLRSPTALVLGALALLGLWFVSMRTVWQASDRAKFSLCGWLAVAMAAELFSAHPTFPSYWILITPFLGILAAAGLYVATMWIPRRMIWWIVPVFGVMLSYALGYSLRKDGGMTWTDLEAVARKVDEVTPPGGMVWADEQIYFLTRRTPVEGTEFSYAQVADIPEEEARSLHIRSDLALDREAEQGRFGAVSTCEDTDVIEFLRLPRLFRYQAAEGGRCHVFWDPAR